MISFKYYVNKKNIRNYVNKKIIKKLKTKFTIRQQVRFFKKIFDLKYELKLKIKN